MRWARESNCAGAVRQDRRSRARGSGRRRARGRRWLRSRAYTSSSTWNWLSQLYGVRGGETPLAHRAQPVGPTRQDLAQRIRDGDGRGRVAQHAAAGVSITDANPGRSDASTGTPAAIASHSFWGVTYWWFSVWAGSSMTMTSDEADHVSSSCGRHGIDDVDRARVHRRSPAISRRRASWLPKPMQHEHRVGDLEDGVHGLLDAAVGQQAALVEHDGVSPGDAQGRADAVGSGLGRIPAVGAVAHHRHVPQAQVALHHRRVGLAHLDDRVRCRAQRRSTRVRMRPLPAGHRGEDAGAQEHVPRVVERCVHRAAAGPAGASAAMPPTCRARCRAARPGRTRRTATPADGPDGEGAEAADGPAPGRSIAATSTSAAGAPASRGSRPGRARPGSWSRQRSTSHRAATRVRPPRRPPARSAHRSDRAGCARCGSRRASPRAAGPAAAGVDGDRVARGHERPSDALRPGVELAGARGQDADSPMSTGHAFGWRRVRHTGAPSPGTIASGSRGSPRPRGPRRTDTRVRASGPRAAPGDRGCHPPVSMSIRSTAPSSPANVVQVGVPSRAASRFMVPPALTTRSAA